MEDSHSLETDNTDNPESTSSLEGTAAESTATSVDSTGKIVDKTPARAKVPLGKRIMSKMNVYLLIFILLLLVAGVIAVSVYLASKKAETTTVPTQTLTSDTLKQLATSDVTVGEPKQVLNVQSNAAFAGKVFVKGSLEVAGAIQVGGSINVPGITVSGNSVFEQIQVNKGLSVQGDTSLQGQLSVQKNLTVAGSATFGGPVSAPSISVNTLQLNGNLSLTRHLAVGGATPGRSNGDALGGGGTTAVSGSDIAGSININTGSGASTGCFVTINFTTKYNTTPRVLITPIGASAAGIGYYVNRTTTNFSVCTATTPPSNASFGFDYFVVE
jgi:cytoskeletal protein CcmA (bactofilin family)